MLRHYAEIEVERKKVEKRAGEIELYLRDYQGSLVDSEGFPRSDIDVREVRLLRNELSRLKTDWKQLTVELEAAVESEFKNQENLKNHPFARVNEVRIGGEGDRVGFKKGDLVVKFGDAVILSQIKRLIGHGEQDIILLRNGELVEFKSKAVDLGVHLVPLGN